MRLSELEDYVTLIPLDSDASLQVRNVLLELIAHLQQLTTDNVRLMAAHPRLLHPDYERLERLERSQRTGMAKPTEHKRYTGRQVSDNG